MLLSRKSKQKTCFYPSDSFNRKPNQSLVHSQEKSRQNYELTVSVLNMLIEKSPRLADELSVVKKALTKWYDHIRQESITRNSQLMLFKENMKMAVKQEFSHILQDIAYYLRTTSQNCQDPNLYEYYRQYLEILKKFNSFPRQKTEQQTQTDSEYPFIIPFPTQRSLQRESLSTIESPVKRVREIDINKYIETKEQNLQLERKCDRLQSTIAQLEEENMKLRAEIAEILLQNKKLKDDHHNHLEDIQKLAQNLEQLKEDDLQRRSKELKQQNITLLTQNRYRRFNDLQNHLHRQLEHAEEDINIKEGEQIASSNLEMEVEKFFSENYEMKDEDIHTLKKITIDEADHEAKYIEKEDHFRMMLTQCLVIQQMISPEE